MTCAACNNTGRIWTRLKGAGPDGWPIDDGDLHITLCMSLVCRTRRGWRPDPEPGHSP